MSRDRRGDGIQEVVSSILIGSTNFILKSLTDSPLRPSSSASPLPGATRLPAQATPD